MEPNIEVATDPTTGEVVPEQQAPTTLWRNPTDAPIVFTLHTSRKRRLVSDAGNVTDVEVQVGHEITIAPGASRKLLSTWDRAIHQVIGCSHAECRQGICKSPATAKGANARIGGGLAPLLVRDGQAYGISRALIPRTEARPTAILPAGSSELTKSGADEQDGAMQRARARAKAGAR